MLDCFSGIALNPYYMTNRNSLVLAVSSAVFLLKYGRKAVKLVWRVPKKQHCTAVLVGWKITHLNQPRCGLDPPFGLHVNGKRSSSFRPGGALPVRRFINSLTQLQMRGTCVKTIFRGLESETDGKEGRQGGNSNVSFFGRQDKPGDPFGFEKILIRENVGSKQLSKTMGSP